MAIINIDVAHDCTISEFFCILEIFDGKIVNFIAEGPGGGNPNVDVEFNDDTKAKAFEKEWNTWWCNSK